MQLAAPLLISARLLPALKIGNVTISLRVDGRTDDNRIIYKAVFDGLQTTEHGFCSGCGDGVDYRRAFGSLLSFLNHSASSAEGDGSLFDAVIDEWTDENLSEIEYLSWELEQ